MLYYALFTVVIIIIGILAVYNGRKPLYNKTILGLVFVSIVSFPFIYFYTLSKPRSIDKDFLIFEKAKVIGSKVVYGEAIYYWLLMPNSTEPRYYVEEWNDSSKKKAEKLNQQKNDLIFEPSLEKDKQLHPLPQPALPKKEPQKRELVPKFDL